MKKVIRLYIKDILLLYVVGFIITMAWRLLELIFYKQVMPDHIDSIFTFILTISIVINVKLFKKNERKS